MSFLKYIYISAFSVFSLAAISTIFVGLKDANNLKINFANASNIGQSYYVSNSGNDNNSGTSIDSPWKTINKLNSINFSSGDTISFKGGETFSGKLYFDTSDSANPATPITVTTYGDGKALLTNADSAIFVYNTAAIKISNINVFGGGISSNSGDGISIYNELPNDTKLDSISIDNVDISGFGKTGINIGAWNNNAGYKNITISHVESHDNGDSGITIYGQNPFVHENINISYVKAFNNSGISTEATRPTGVGVSLGATVGGKIEHSIAYNNGWLNKASSGPVGLWTYDSKNIVIQFNESYSNKTGGTADGDGFDLDQNVSDSIMQYNYSHDNDGAGFIMAHGPNNSLHTGNTIRYNISQNDSRKNGYGAIQLWGKILNASIYNNTIYLAAAPKGTPPAISIQNWTIESQIANNVSFYNNILYTKNSLPMVSVSATQLTGSPKYSFIGNNYYAESSSPKYIWGSKTYSDLTQWQSGTGNEILNGTKSGISLNPELVAAGAGTTINDTDNLKNLTAYALTPASPLIDKGIDLVKLFSINMGVKDFYLTLIPQNAYDIGAAEFQTSAPPSSSPIASGTPLPSNTPSPVPSFTPSPNPSSASSINVYPIADTYVRTDSTSSNYGSSTKVSISNTRIGLITFDLTNVVTGSSAKLQLYNVNGSKGQLVVRAISNSSWSEKTVTYKNKPAAGIQLALFSPFTATKIWNTVDMSSYIIPKLGQLISLQFDTTSTDTYEFNSKEYSNATLRSYLQIQ